MPHPVLPVQDDPTLPTQKELTHDPDAQVLPVPVHAAPFGLTHNPDAQVNPERQSLAVEQVAPGGL